jgi:hypothetical protein
MAAKNLFTLHVKHLQLVIIVIVIVTGVQWSRFCAGATLTTRPFRESVWQKRYILFWRNFARNKICLEKTVYKCIMKC